MQHLAALLSESLDRSSVSPQIAAACRMHLSFASSVRLAVGVASDAVAMTSNLAAEGPLALLLLPGTSAAGQCISSASPHLVDGHTTWGHAGAASCRGFCKSTLYVPISAKLDSGRDQAGHADSADQLPACACLVVAFRCDQLGALQRSVPLLTAFAGALGATLPAAAAPLQQIMSAVLAGEPQPFGGSGHIRKHGAAAADVGGSSGISGAAGRSAYGTAAAPPGEGLSDGSCSSSDGCSWSDEASDSNDSSDVGSDSDIVTPDNCDIGIDGAIARQLSSSSDVDSDGDHESPLSASEQTVLGAESLPKLEIRVKAPPLDSSPGHESEVNEPGLQPATPAVVASLPEYNSNSSIGAGSDSRSENGGLKPAQAQRSQPPGLQRGTAAPSEAAFVTWHAAHSYQADVVMLVALLANVMSKGARPPAWLFWNLSAPSLTYAAVNAACMFLAILAPRVWRARRETALTLLWAALVNISVCYASSTQTLEAMPTALLKPLWAARAFAVETTLVGPVAMRVRFRRGVPLILLHFTCAVATAPRVCRSSAYAAVPLRLCSAAAWALQAVFCLAVPLLLCRWLDAHARKQFWASGPSAEAAGPACHNVRESETRSG